MPRGPALQVTAVLLFVHVLIVYLIKSVVLQQFCHSILSPADADKRGVLAYAKHGSFGFAMLVFGYLVANAVPFFSQLLGLIGGFLGGPINFLFPIYMYLAAAGRHEQALCESKSDANKSEEDEPNSWQTSSATAAIQGLKSL